MSRPSVARSIAVVDRRFKPASGQTAHETPLQSLADRVAALEKRIDSVTD